MLVEMYAKVAIMIDPFVMVGPKRKNNEKTLVQIYILDA
jgi:hypothetical protein